MKQSLSLRTAQHLTLTPQLQQSIRLLQLSTLELSQEVQQQLAQNPFLEMEGDEESLAPEGSQALAEEGMYGDAEEGNGANQPEPQLEQDWAQLQEAPAYDAASEWDGMDAGGPQEAPPRTLEESLGTFDGPIGQRSAHQADSDDEDWIQTRSGTPTLQDHLREQCAGLLVGQTQRIALLYLIDNLDEHGFVAEPLADLAADFTDLLKALGLSCELALEDLETAQDRLQQMDPLGVGATDLPECLRLQLLARLKPGHDAKVIALALKLTRHPLELLAKRDYRQLSRLCQATEAMTRQACDLIKTLEPQPSRPFANTQSQEMVPDVVVRRLGAQWEVQLNPQVMPRLRVHDFGHPVVSSEKLATPSPMQQALLDARWFVKSVAQRFETILRVSRCIVERQKGFFEKGPLALKPMVLREVADELGLHESTISRVTSSKFMATPLGTFELKYFFTSGLSSDGGQETSSTAVRALIAQWVAEENPARPLSDQKLTELLADQGIACARRTVAKYREALKIPPTSMRRSH